MNELAKAFLWHALRRDNDPSRVLFPGFGTLVTPCPLTGRAATPRCRRKDQPTPREPIVAVVRSSAWKGYGHP